MRCLHKIFGALVVAAGIGLAVSRADTQALVQRNGTTTMAGGSLCLGALLSANMNSTADQTITINSSKWIPRRFTVTNASASLTTCLGGFYTAASKGGTNLIAATQSYATLTGSSKFMDLTLAAILTTDLRTETTVYFSLTTGQGSGATADIFIFGENIQ